MAEVDIDMAPPSKRRRVTYDTAQDIKLPRRGDASDEPGAAFPDDLQQLSDTHLIPSIRPLPQRIDEVHQIIQKTVISDEHAHLYRRQATAATSSGLTLTISVSAQVDLLGSITALLTLDGIVPGYAVTEMTTLFAATKVANSALTSTPSATQASSSSTSQLSPSSQIQASSPTPSSTSSNVSSASGSASFLVAALSATTPSDGYIALNPVGSSSNITTAPTPTGIVSLSSSSANLTTSALIFEINGSFTTSKTTIDLSNVTTSSSASQDSLGPLAYIATLSDGSVQTITRETQAYATTLPDGEVSTIASYSGSAFVSTVVSTLPDGRTSTFLETLAASRVAGASTVTGAAPINGAGYGQATATSTQASSTSSAASSSNNTPTPPPAGTIAGGVVGGAAGLAVVMLIAMLFLRWYRLRAQTGRQSLPPSTAMSPEPDRSPSFRSPGMAERAGMTPLIGAVPAMFRHQNQPSAVSEPDSESSQRGFARVSGRKLPSQFSPGVSAASASATTPSTRHEHNLSSTSFYRDSQGFYGGPGGGGGGDDDNRPISFPSSTALGVVNVSPEEQMTLSPGPQRTPTLHHGGPYVMAPTTPTGPGSPRTTVRSASPPPLAGFARSGTPTSMDGTRPSRFAEDV